MIYTQNYKIGLSDITKYGYLTDESILQMFENTSSFHSDIVGYGVEDIEKTKRSWVLLEWKYIVKTRPKYGQTLEISTYGRDFSKATTYRDFIAKDEKTKQTLIIATSKWSMIDIENNKLVKMADDVKEKYQPENIKIMENPEHIILPESKIFRAQYSVSLSDIDINNHMHNTKYLKALIDTIPDELKQKYIKSKSNYKNLDMFLIDNFHIVYKNPSVLKEKIFLDFYCRKCDFYVKITRKDEKLKSLIQFS